MRCSFCALCLSHSRCTLSENFCFFLGFHVPRKDGRRGWQKKQEVSKYPNDSETRNFDSDGIEDVRLKADYLMNNRNFPDSTTYFYRTLSVLDSQ